MKRIAVITGSRADYGIYYPVLRALQVDKDFELQLIVTGMHLLSEFGESWKEIERDGFKITLKIYPPGREAYNPCRPLSYMVDWVSAIMHQLIYPLEYLNPDCVVVLADRGEMLAATIAAAHMGILIAHIQGGDKTGNIDDAIRRAITCFATFHFPTLEEHRVNILRMLGGVPFTPIKVVGPLGIYAMKDAEFTPRENLNRGLGLSDKLIVLVIQHPVTTEVDKAGQQIRETLEAVKSFGDTIQPVIIYPNSDAGCIPMIREIEKSGLKAFKNLPYLTFISLLKVSSVIVGNSSAGLVEAPYFGMPCVNIGSRQTGRMGGSETLNVDYKQDIIRTAINEILNYNHRMPKYQNPYALQIDGVKVILDTLKEEL